MTQADWSECLSLTIAEQVKRRRRELGLSAQQLADRTAGLGMQIPRSVLANFESGRRNTVSVAELIILAAALDCPPVELALPSRSDGTVELLPHGVRSVSDAEAWFTAARRCAGCANEPPRGFTCNTCGRSAVTSSADNEPPLAEIFELTKPPDGRLSDELLRNVAGVYLATIKAGNAPAPAIATLASIPVRTAHRWVAEARSRGFLSPTTRGKTG